MNDNVVIRVDKEMLRLFILYKGLMLEVMISALNSPLLSVGLLLRYSVSRASLFTKLYRPMVRKVIPQIYEANVEEYEDETSSE